jgi:hypothetical protein
MSAILGAISALGTIISTIWDLYHIIKKTQAKNWVKDVKVITGEMKAVKTDEQRKALASRLADHINRL